MMISKPRRIEDPDLLKRIKNKGSCQMPGCEESVCDPHHIKTKGSGGNDVSKNIVRLCHWVHHPQAHTGQIPKAVLRELALKRIREEKE